MKEDTPLERVWAKSYPNGADIDGLLAEMEKHKLPPSSIEYLHDLGTMSAEVRLAVNLKQLLALALKHHIDNILSDGLTPQERKLLGHVDGALSVPLREIAHGLLNVHERWVLARALAKSFREAKAAKNSQLLPKRLDGILGSEEA